MPSRSQRDPRVLVAALIALLLVVGISTFYSNSIRSAKAQPIPTAPPPAHIGNYVWIDENEDGYQDAGEVGIPNIVVIAQSSLGPTFTSITDANGGYSIPVPAGAFTVTVDESTLPVGLTQTTNPVLPGADLGNQSQPYVLTVADGDENLTADFGYNWGTPDNPPSGALGTIGDRVWIDADGDGAQDSGEPGIGDVELAIYYDSNSDGKVEPGVDTVFTGAVDQNGATGTGTTKTHPDGTYIFDKLPAGPYIVIVNTPPDESDYTQTGDPDDFGLPATDPDNRTTVPVVLEPGDVFLNADFGYQPLDNGGDLDGSIGDTVFYDLDADGVYEPGDSDSGIPGITVYLALDDNDNSTVDPGEIIATDITDADGNYLFDGLPSGRYLVVVNDTQNIVRIGSEFFRTIGPEQTANDHSKIPPYLINLGAGEDNLTADFGYTPSNHAPEYGLIGDTVWLDINNNGMQETDEPGLEGIEVTLTLPNSSTRTTTTNENGNYYFGRLTDSFYTVTVTTPPAGLLQSFDDDLPLDHQSTHDLGLNEINLDQDFGYYGPGTIGDLVWNDIDADGVRDANEQGIGEVTLDLYLDLNGDGDVDPGEPLVGRQTTDDNGAYLFQGLPIDDGDGNAQFVVDVTDEANLLSGYWHSLGTTGANDNSQLDPYAVTLTLADPHNVTADFGYYVLPAAVGDRVWRDDDGNGIQDAGEADIPNIDVTLTISYPNGDVIVLVDTTDANGLYLFGNLLLDEDYNGLGTAGNEGEPVFVIAFDTPAGLVSTPANVGADDGVDSNGLSTLAEPVMGSPILTYDSGFVPPAVIGDFVWNDANANGIQDPSEIGVPGVTVSLLDADGNSILDGQGNPITTTTTITGFYQFLVAPGDYRVNFSNFPGGQQLTVPLQGSDTALDSDPNVTTRTTGVVTVGPGEVNLTIDAGLTTPTAIDDLPDQPRDPEDRALFLPMVSGDR